jgi:hypothetical protein
VRLQWPQKTSISARSPLSDTRRNAFHGNAWVDPDKRDPSHRSRRELWPWIVPPASAKLAAF